MSTNPRDELGSFATATGHVVHLVDLATPTNDSLCRVVDAERLTAVAPTDERRLCQLCADRAPHAIAARRASAERRADNVDWTSLALHYAAWRLKCLTDDWRAFDSGSAE